eukprot:snap_masked-scaffold_15-processed-gene-8.38-mRNA-1 protein AED:1.00 eAED:1.00 QI:0/0/0/0/1/1/2/0/320
MGGNIATNHVCEYPHTFTRDFAETLNESAWLDPSNTEFCTSTYSEYFGRTWALSNMVFYFLYFFLYPSLLYMKIGDLRALAFVQRKSTLELPQFPVLFLTIFHAIADFDSYGLKGMYSFDVYHVFSEVRNICLVLIGFAVIDFLTSTVQMQSDSLYTKKTTYMKLTAAMIIIYFGPMIAALSDKEKNYNSVMGLRRTYETVQVSLTLAVSMRRKQDLLKQLRQSATTTKNEAEKVKLEGAMKRISESFLKYHTTVSVLIGLCGFLAFQGLQSFGHPLVLDPRDSKILASRLISRGFFYSITGILLGTFRVKNRLRKTTNS